MTVAFLGDSITLGYALEDKEKRYTALVSDALGMQEMNFGICGTLIAKAGLNVSDGNDFLSRIGLVSDADIAVIFGGTNDYFWSDSPIYGDGECYFSCALEKIICKLKEARGDKPTLFVTPYPHNGIGNYKGGMHWKDSNRHDTDAVNFNGHTLLDYVSVIEELCAENGVHCLNLHKDLEFCHQKHTVDGCHPNEEGHRLIANAIERKIKEIFSI